MYFGKTDILKVAQRVGRKSASLKTWAQCELGFDVNRIYGVKTKGF
jgi:hypothetical protein